MNNIASNLRKLRVRRGLSQKDMATKLHKSQPAYAQMENGTTKVDFDQLEQLAKLFEVEIADLLHSEDAKTNNYNNSKLNNSPGFVEHYYGGIREAYEETIRSLKESHAEIISQLKESHEEVVRLLKEEIEYNRNHSNNTKSNG
jgi:transcriptional regulator with XRE-family HTH domain